MHHRRIVLTLALAVLAAALILPAMALATTTPTPTPPTFGNSIDTLIAHHYPQTIENHLDSLGDTTLGFRLAGSPADNAAAGYVETKFKGAGLVNVRQEAVPVDVWDMQGAWVQVNGRTMAASQFDGVPGTKGPLTAPVVYVHDGTAADYDGVDVTGKLVLVDLALDQYWMNLIGAEAVQHGAIGVIATYGPDSGAWYAVPQSLGANDGEYDMSFAPIAYISRADGEWLRALAKTGPVTATMNSAVDITMHDFATPADGGQGYDVVGEIPGTDPNAKAILFAAHHDAHFRAGMDDTGALTNMIMMAKAMKQSGYQPKRTIIFMATTGEEFGYTNAWYDWSIGAWWAATHRHATGTADPWTGADGRIAAFINLELMARKGGPLEVSSSTALAPWVKAAAKASPGLLTWGSHVTTPISTWEDGWTFTAAGVPSLVMEAGGKNYDTIYHTTFETKALVNYAYLGRIARFAYKLDRQADAGLLPYDLKAQATDLAKWVDGDELKAAGADGMTADAAVSAVRDYAAAAGAYQARRAHIPVAHRATVNDGLLAVEKTWNMNLTGLDIWDYQAYPFQQTLWDTETLNQAIELLKTAPMTEAVKNKALETLNGVALTWYGTTFSHAVYAKDLTRRVPDYELITWAGEVDMPWHVDITPQVDLVNAGDYATAVTQLTAVRDAELAGATEAGQPVAGLNQRLASMTSTLNDLTTAVKALK